MKKILPLQVGEKCNLKFQYTFKNKYITSIPTRMVVIRKRSVSNNVEKLEFPMYSSWECKVVQPLWRTVYKFLKCVNMFTI